MRSHLAMVALLAVGALMSATGSALAFQGFGRSGDDASKAQYPPGTNLPTNQPGRPGGELGPAPSNQPDPPGGPPLVGGPNQPERPTVVVDGDVLGVADTEVPRQVEAGSTLPFTGFAALPVLVLAVGLLAAGLVIRRTTGRKPG